MPTVTWPRPVPATGPRTAQIMIVGEAPGQEEVTRGEPFVGMSGQELNRMLGEAGISRAQCFVTNVCHERPPLNDITNFFGKKSDGIYPEYKSRYPKQPIVDGLTQLRKDLIEIKPKVIICLGGTALWGVSAVLGEHREGIEFWRGSQIITDYGWIVPTYHPAAILRNYDLRQIAVNDLRRARRCLDRVEPPKEVYLIEKGFERTIIELKRRIADKTRIAVDIESDPQSKHITCIGIAWSAEDAICIPFVDKDGHNFWTEDEELIIILNLRELLTSPTSYVIGHNFQFDQQMIARWWGFMPRLDFDTMIAQHVCWPGMLKALDFCASLYLPFYCQWSMPTGFWKNPSWDLLWHYNCKDVTVTWQLHDQLRSLIAAMDREQVLHQQMVTLPVIMEMMLRGVRIDTEKLPVLAGQIDRAILKRNEFIEIALGHPFNAKSPAQLKALLYRDFRVKPRKSRTTGKPSTNKEALAEIKKAEPYLSPLLNAIEDVRRFGVLKSNFLEAEPDADGRFRTSYNLAGPHTFRLSSSESIFGTGLNLQNIPKSDKGASIGVNLREAFLPDEGYILLECDLDRADLQVVVWEAADAVLKEALRSGEDIHMLNAKAIFGSSAGPKQRQLAKGGVHATNYGCRPKTLAASLGITVKEAEDFQKRWFAAHPGIRTWQRRVETELQTTRKTSNKFGYIRPWLGRVETILPEALAWIPQSTVGLVTNKAMVQLKHALPQVRLTMQIHDSIVFQLPVAAYREHLPVIRKALEVVVPYEDPLIIPFSLKGSAISWADCRELDWETGNAAA